MISLKRFSTAMLSATSIQLSDIQMSMSIGENYAKQLHSFIVETFNVHDFTCSDNGIVKNITLLVENDTVSIDMISNPLGKKTLTISSTEKTLTSDYSSFDDFKTSLSNMKTL